MKICRKCRRLIREGWFIGYKSICNGCYQNLPVNQQGAYLQWDNYLKEND